jgi:hypothetical protein
MVVGRNWGCALASRTGKGAVNVVVLGPGLEARPLPYWALKPVPDDRLTGFELLVRRIGEEIHSLSPVTIVGLPWVNPRGRARVTASVSDYLNDPVSLFRALTVAFTAERGSPAEAAVVAGNASLGQQVACAKEWVEARLVVESPGKALVWVVLEPRLEKVLQPEGQGDASEEDWKRARDTVRSLPLPARSRALKALCDALHEVFT